MVLQKRSTEKKVLHKNVLKDVGKTGSLISFGNT